MSDYNKNKNNWIAPEQENEYRKYESEFSDSKITLYISMTTERVYQTINMVENNDLKAKILEFMSIFELNLKDYIKNNNYSGDPLPLNLEIESDSVDIYWKSEYSGIYFTIYMDKISWFYTAVSDQESMSRAGTIYDLNTSANIIKERIGEMLRC